MTDFTAICNFSRSWHQPYFCSTKRVINDNKQYAHKIINNNAIIAFTTKSNLCYCVTVIYDIVLIFHL